MRMAKCDAMFVYATSGISRRIFEKLGMELFKEEVYKDIVIDGDRPYQNVEFESVSSFYMKVPTK